MKILFSLNWLRNESFSFMYQFNPANTEMSWLHAYQRRLDYMFFLFLCLFFNFRDELVLITEKGNFFLCYQRLFKKWASILKAYWILLNSHLTTVINNFISLSAVLGKTCLEIYMYLILLNLLFFILNICKAQSCRKTLSCPDISKSIFYHIYLRSLFLPCLFSLCLWYYWVVCAEELPVWILLIASLWYCLICFLYFL